jgi:glutathione peroxidase
MTYRILVLTGALLTLGVQAQAQETPSIYTHEVQTIDGEQTTLEEYRGQVLLIVNTASRCGFTPQYEGLEELHQRYADQGLVVLAFPCNQFGGQEPGTEAEIKTFCEETYEVTFPLFAKVDVNGDTQHPLWAELTGGQGNQELAGRVRWNFSKFLINRQGQLVARFGSGVAPESQQLTDAVEAELERDAAFEPPLWEAAREVDWTPAARIREE